MLTRREALLGGLGMGAGALMGGFNRAEAEAAQPQTKVSFPVPPKACDCHVHIFDPMMYPYFSGRTYTPEPASLAELDELHQALGIARTVVVQPSVYGTDNACTRHAVRMIGPSARGVAVIGDKTSNRELDDLHQIGFRGIRINIGAFGASQLDEARRRVQAGLARVGPRGWHIQIFAPTPIVAGLKDIVAGSPVPFVFDHFGGAKGGDVNQAGFSELVAMVRSGRAYVKISALYRVTDGPDYGEAAPLARALIAANSERVVWGSDWPHPDTRPPAGGTAKDVSSLLQVDDGRILSLLAEWAPDAALRQRILVENPARLYGFT